MTKKSRDVPDGLREMLTDFTIAVMRTRPQDLTSFAAEYFQSKMEEKKSNAVDDVADSDDEIMVAPTIRTTRRQGVAAESYDPEKESAFVKVVHDKTEEQRQRLIKATKGILLFGCLEEEQMSDVIDAMYERKVEPGERVITLGEDGDNFYVVESGVYEIIIKVNGQEKNVGQYNNTGSFGELALMYNCPRAATIIASTPGVLWVMTRDVFRHIVYKSAHLKRKLYEELLEEVPILSSLCEYERTSIADALHSKTFEEGTRIITQGEAGEEMYFVEEGEVRIMMRSADSSDEKELTRVKKGGYFGELALLTKHPRAASAYAISRTKLAVLDVGSFERLLGPCLDILKRNIDNYENQLKNVFGSLDKVPELRH